MDALPPSYELPPSHPDVGDLPSYDARGSSHVFTFSSTAGINDKLNTTFRIGDKHTPALVLPSDLEAHLLLLGAFHRLREEVRTQKGTIDRDLPPFSPDDLWAVFLQRAVYRFQLWVTQMQDVIAAEEALESGTGTETVDGKLDYDRVPPLDVILIWHTYMLNPLDYHEDCLRMHPGLLTIGKTLIDYATGMPVPELAARYTAILLSFKHNPTPQVPEEIGKRHGWWITSVEKIIRFGFMDKMDKPYLETPRPLQIVLSAYQNPGPFSIDLASAVMRQMSFVDKMVSFGWTEHGRFEDDKDTLVRCVNRYHAFLDLMTSTPGSFVVPSLVPDHDDKVNESAIAEAYDQTADAWKAKFGVPYSVCGCLPPSASKTTSALGGGLFSLKGKSKAAPNGSIVNNPRPDLLSLSDMHADETHPSEHNSVAILNPPAPTTATPQVKMEEQGAALAEARKGKMEKRVKDVRKLSERGKSDEWTELQSRRREPNASTHTHAFLCPVEFGVKDPFGQLGHGDCAVYSGKGLDSPLGAGQCANGNGHNGMCTAVFDVARGGIQQAINTATVMTGNSSYMRDVNRARAYGSIIQVQQY
ncbi:hypothetical protein FRB97_003552 [Tulasnella sp. 331]|nr:hypothetical protein FRB97_003552 [Tulasnella sp. 331]